jgi:hypothetical protein
MVPRASILMLHTGGAACSATSSRAYEYASATRCHVHKAIEPGRTDDRYNALGDEAGAASYYSTSKHVRAAMRDTVPVLLCMLYYALAYGIIGILCYPARAPHI